MDEPHSLRPNICHCSFSSSLEASRHIKFEAQANHSRTTHIRGLSGVDCQPTTCPTMGRHRLFLEKRTHHSPFHHLWLIDGVICGNGDSEERCGPYPRENCHPEKHSIWDVFLLLHFGCCLYSGILCKNGNSSFESPLLTLVNSYRSGFKQSNRCQPSLQLYDYCLS